MNRRRIFSIVTVGDIQRRSYIDNAPVPGNFFSIFCSRLVFSSLAFIAASNFNSNFLTLEDVFEAFFQAAFSSPRIQRVFKELFLAPQAIRLIQLLLTRSRAAFAGVGIPTQLNYY